MRSQRLVFRQTHFKCLDILSRSNILIKESVKRLSSTFSLIKISEKRERDGYREIKGSDAVCMRPVIEPSTQWEGRSNHQIPDWTNARLDSSRYISPALWQLDIINHDSPESLAISCSPPDDFLNPLGFGRQNHCIKNRQVFLQSQLNMTIPASHSGKYSEVSKTKQYWKMS